jgi:hypothetical protein
MVQRRIPIVLIALLGCVLIGAGVALALGGERAGAAAPTLTSKPAARTTSTTAAFAYRASVRQARFRCSLDGARYRRCGTKRTYSRLAVGAHQFCVKSVRARRSSPATCYAWTILAIADVVAPPVKDTPTKDTPTVGQEFSIRGDATALLMPGGAAVPIELILTNPNAVAITIQSITMRVTRVVPTSCAAAIVVTGQLNAVPIVAAGRTSSLTALNIPTAAWPTLAMLDTKTDQDACANATIALGFSGTAVG